MLQQQHDNENEDTECVNKYLQRRAQYGTYNSLMIDLLQLDDVKFCNYVRMPPEEFNTLWWRGGLVVGRRTCDLVVAGSRPGRDAAA